MWQHLDMTEVAVITAEDTVAKDPRVPVSPHSPRHSFPRLRVCFSARSWYKQPHVRKMIPLGAI